jgi:hypothetical protein
MNSQKDYRFCSKYSFRIRKYSMTFVNIRIINQKNKIR